MFSRVRFVEPRHLTGLSLLAILGGQVWGADSSNGPLAPGDDDVVGTVSTRFKLDEKLGYESNPQYTNYRYNASRRHASDGFSESLGLVKAGFHSSVPLNLVGEVEAKNYFHTHALDTTIAHAEVEAPFRVGKKTTIAPDVYVENQWDDGRYYQTETRFTARWTQDWSRILSTDVAPYYSILDHSRAFESYNGYDTGIDANITWELDHDLVESYAIDVGTRRYHAQTSYFGYRNPYVEGSVEVTPGWGLELRASLKAAEDVYSAKDPQHNKVRHDRSLEPAIEASRNLTSWFKVHVRVDTTRTRSNIKADSYRDSVIAVGGTLRL